MAKKRPAKKAIAEHGQLRAKIESRMIDVDQIDPSPYQVRQGFPAAEIQGLADSFGQVGQVQPVNVRLVDERYQLIDGERRWRAAKLAGLTEIRAEVGDCDDATARAMVIVTGIQRKELDPLEEAAGFRMMLDAGDSSGPGDLAGKFGLSQGHVSNRLRLLKLPAGWRKRIISGEMSATQARSLGPWVDYPDILAAIDKEWAAARTNYREETETVSGVDELVGRVVERRTRPLSGTWYEQGQGDTKVFTPSDEERAELGVVDVVDFDNHKEARATNTKRWDELQKAFSAERKKSQPKRGQKAAKKKDSPHKAETAGEKKKRLAGEENERKRREAESARVFFRRLWEWRVDWLRRLCAEECQDLDQDVVLRLLLFSSFDTPGGGRRLRQAMAAAKAKLKKKNGWPDTWGSLAALAPEVVSRVAEGFAAGLFWEDDKPSPLVNAPDVERIAKLLGVDTAAAWAIEHAGPLTERYWRLHSKEQLFDLVEELGVKAVSASTKDAIVDLLLGRTPNPEAIAGPNALPMPKELKTVRRPK